MKNIFLLIAALVIVLSCDKKTEEQPDKGVFEINKAIELASSNKAINDSLSRYRREFGVDFILCYSIVKDGYRSLGFQPLQWKKEKNSPLKIDNKPYKIKNIQGIDIMFCTSESDPKKEYNIEIDSKTKELINKGYLTVTGRNSTFCTPSIDFAFCMNDDTKFAILSPDFKWKEEVKARKKDVPYIIESYYPKCN